MQRMLTSEVLSNRVMRDVQTLSSKAPEVLSAILTNMSGMRDGHESKEKRKCA